MLRSSLLQALHHYGKTWLKHPHFFIDIDLEFESNTIQTVQHFIQENQNCFERTNIHGHVTGSALVTNPTLTRVLLTHHKKLGMWLQLGGHADGNPHIEDVAMTEACEESGLTRLKFLQFEHVFGLEIDGALPFDLDYHVIPQSEKDESHVHYDIRYIIVGDDSEAHVVSDESLDVKWFGLEEAGLVTREVSMHRQFEKLKILRSLLA